MEVLQRLNPFESTSSQPFNFLGLPRELRDQIYGQLFFPGEDDPDKISKFSQNSLGLGHTAVRQIHPYDNRPEMKPRFNLTIFRTCKQIQTEAEYIFYGTSSFNLMYQDWSDSIKVSYEFFEKLPRRYRRLIRRVERKCYSQPYWGTISLFDWTLFMRFLAHECPSLQSLTLWGPGDSKEGPPWVTTCQKDAAWVQAMLQIKTLRAFDIPVIPGGVIYNYPAFKDDFFPWLKSSLLEASKCSANAKIPQTAYADGSAFRFLDLPKSVRNIVYRKLLLPEDRKLHPYIGPWGDQTTCNIMPLFLSCPQIHKEAELILYGEAIFASLIKKYHNRLSQFFRHLNPRLLGLVRHLDIGNACDTETLVQFALKSMELDTLRLEIEHLKARQMERVWRNRTSPNWKIGDAGWNVQTLRGFSQLKQLDLDVSPFPLRSSEFLPQPSTKVRPECLDWYKSGLVDKSNSQNERIQKMLWSTSMDGDRGYFGPALLGI
ncbi:MAG: hypothetical protein M1834_000776 [Cirrosporium novae-zelandiae]|nr:MAG: hypothetical protein M1834_000776 [Cirrosporium novae-zelandiae]